MTKRNRLLAASLLVSIPSFTACTETTPGMEGSAGGTLATGGVGTGGSTPGAKSTTGDKATSGGKSGASDSKANSGGKTSSSESKASSGGKSISGESKATSGGTKASSGDSKASGGTKASSGTKASTGGSNSSSGDSKTSGGNTASSSSSATTNPGTGGGGNPDVKCTLPTLPESSALTTRNEKLPDPFTFYDGTKVTTKDQWECRRQEILAMAAKYIYAPVPTKPDEVTGTVSGGTVSITAKVGSKTETFSATISGSGSVIALELSGGIFPSSRKKLSFGSGFENKIKNLFGFSSAPNTNIANGWMIDRVMDVLEKNPSSGHDPTKIMVSGCSGCGKGAYLAGVFSRVPLVVIVESGGGGAANLRQAEWFRHGDGKSVWQCADALPQSIDNLEDSGICGPWVTGAAQWLRSSPAKVYNLPFDTHLLLATIAPRYLLHFSNANGKDSWCHLGGTCEALSSWAAKSVWKALGVPERMGFHMYSAGHCSNPAEATSLAGDFFKRAFEGSTTAKTDVMDILSNGVQQPVSEWESMWIDWDMETVLN